MWHYFMDLRLLRKYFVAISDRYPQHGQCASCQRSPSPIVCQTCINALPRVAFRCVQCAKPMPDITTHQRCHDCLTLPPAFDETRCIGQYQQTLKNLILRAKHQREVQAIQALRYVFVEQIDLSVLDLTNSCLVAVPSPALRQAARGFNVPQLLAVSLHRRYDIAMVKHALKTPFYLPRHTRQSRKARLSKSSPYRPTSDFLTQIDKTPDIILVDDVLTTGSTANGIAKTLKANGAKSVTVLVVAR